MWEGFGGVIRCGGKRMGRHPTKVKETPEVVVFIPHTPGMGGKEMGEGSWCEGRWHWRHARGREGKERPEPIR